MHANRFVRSSLIVAASLLVAMPQNSLAAPQEIVVVSNRADLISGGDALVEIKWPAGTNLAGTTVSLNGVSVKSAFAMRPNGRYMGVVTGMNIGNNVVLARHAGGAAQIAINNHPIAGPVFSGGQQLAPWICARKTVTPVTVVAPGDPMLSGTANTRASGLSSDPIDAACNTPAEFLYYYQPKAKEGASCTFTIAGATPCFQAYPVVNDPASRPADTDIANFTNDRGATVKSLLRLEKGTINRAIYQVLAYYDPAQPFSPWAPQKGWNGKLMWKMGAATSANHFEAAPSASIFDANALSAGFMTANHMLTEHSVNNNELLGTEAVMMVKEHIIETYGEIRYTMSDGGSGGSMMQTVHATVMPGLLNGIQPSLSYPDAVSTWIETMDCGLIRGSYSLTPNGSVLSEAQRAAIEGHPNSAYCNSWVQSFLGSFNPVTANNCGAGFPAAITYDPVLRPKGVRCSVHDIQEPQWGSFVDTDGHTKVKLPYDNVGVQYGLKALQAGVLSPEEFVRLNEGVGSYNNDRVWSGGSTSSPTIPAPRHAAQTDVLSTIYKSGILADGKQLAKVAIIDLRGHSNVADIHMPWRGFSERDRLDRANGNHDNQVIRHFFGGTGAAAVRQSFNMLDRWLAKIESDRSAIPLEKKIVNNKPVEVHDACFNTTGGTDAQVDPSQDVGLGSAGCLVKNMMSPRIVAGGPYAENIFKCQLKPMGFASPDYNGMTFTEDHKARMATVFPSGVCDWTLPGVGQTAAAPTTFTGGPGGVPLGVAPVSVPLR